MKNTTEDIKALRELNEIMARLEFSPATMCGCGSAERIKITKYFGPSDGPKEMTGLEYIRSRTRIYLDSWVLPPMRELAQKLEDRIAEANGWHYRLSFQSPCLTVMLVPREGNGPAVAVLDMTMFNDLWYVNRVLIAQDQHRRCGIGTALMRRALEHVVQAGLRKGVLVEPGGYGTPWEVLSRFYTRQGFHPVNGMTNMNMVRQGMAFAWPWESELIQRRENPET